MKKNLRLALGVAFAAYLLAACGDDVGNVYQWRVYLPPAVGGPALYGISGAARTDIWAVGEGGTILHYDGARWKEYAGVVTDRDLFDVTMVTPETGWAVGEDGLILHYAGGNWYTRVIGDGRDLRAVAAVSAGRAYAVGDGGAIFKFDGAEWTADEPEGLTTDLRDVAVYPDGTGWAVGDAGLILRYDGAKWREVASPTAVRLNAVALRADEAYAVGDNGVILRYADNQWRLMASPASRVLLGVSFCASGVGFACGNGGTVLGYKDGQWGVAEVNFDDFQPNNMNGVLLFNSGGGWAVGDQGLILRYGRLW